MGIFKRLFKVGQAEANSLVDKLEDPIKMTEQGIRDLKKDLDKSLQALAEVKAMAIRSKRELNTNKSKAKDYENKAMLLLKKAQTGDMDTAEAERLATEALTRKEECVQNAARSETDVNQFDTNISQLEKNINALKSKISKYENELKTLKARAKVSEATRKINKSLSSVDSSGTISMLEKMKDKVAEEEALAEAYGDVALETKSLDDEIEDALADENKVKAQDALADLKAKLNQ